MKKYNHVLAFLVLAAGSINISYAQDMFDDTDELLQDGSAIQMDSMQIEGKISPSEMLRRRREKLEDRNKVMVEKKIEDIRVKQEIALTNKLQDAFNKGLNNVNEDKVAVKEAAPIAPQPVVIQPTIIEKVIEKEKVVEKEVEKKSRVIPSIGYESLKGADIDLETKLSLDLQLETKINPNTALGFSIGYSTMSATDLYTGMQNRPLSYGKLKIGANGKYIFAEDAKLRPYLGGELAYNRTTLKYDDNLGTSIYGNQMSSNVSSSYASLALKMGAELDLNQMMGINLEASFTKSLVSGNNLQSTTNVVNIDQSHLENVSRSIDKADNAQIRLGLMLKF